MYLDIEKLKFSYNERLKNSSGVTVVAFHDQTIDNWFQKFTNEINQKIKAIMVDLYFEYGSHKHITIIGLENGEIQKNKYNDLYYLLKVFPKLDINNFRLSLTNNGMIISEFYLTDTERKKLTEYRKNFEQVGISYKHLNSIGNFHSVLGQLIPSMIDTIELTKLEILISEVNKVLDVYNNDNIFSNLSVLIDDVKIIKYDTTTLAKVVKQYNIANIKEEDIKDILQ